MAIETENWSLTKPEAGEADTSEVWGENLDIIDDALFTSEQKASVLSILPQIDGSGGEPGDAWDAIHTAPDTIPSKVTTSHYHHAPKRVPEAASADTAASADYATVAGSLTPPLSVNGSAVTGNDILVPRVAWGSSSPDVGWPQDLGSPRRGDLYIQTV